MYCHAGDREQQEEEILALQAILAEAFTSSGPGRAEVLILFSMRFTGTAVLTCKLTKDANLAFVTLHISRIWKSNSACIFSPLTTSAGFSALICTMAMVPLSPLPFLFRLTLSAWCLEKICHDAIQVCIPSADAPNKVTVSIYLPDKYPSSAAPVLELHGGSMSSEQQAEAIQQLHDLFQPGEVSHCETVSSP